MPVLGHAFVGLAIGIATRPLTRDRSQAPGRVACALWLPASVTLAYFPDLVTQLGVLTGWSDGRLLGHSILLVLPASLAIAAVLMRLTAVSFTRALFTSLVSLLLHDVLDVAQASDRAPWWPLSARRVGSDSAFFPTDSVHEAVVFGSLLLAFLAVLRVARWDPGHSVANRWSVVKGHSWRVWLGAALIVSVVLAAVVTHALRDAREAQLET